MSSTLADLGVSEALLSEADRSCLDKYGYVNLGKLLSDAQLDVINTHLDLLLEIEGENAGSELLESRHIRHPKEEGVDRLADLVNKGEVFDLFYTHATLLAGVAWVLGELFQLSALNYRAAKPGMGLQKLHVDWHEAIAEKDYKVCNSIWLLDSFTKENGATRIVPGSHLKGQLPQDLLDDPWLPHPEEVLIEAPAGSVVLFNSHAWHGGTVNTTNLQRRAIHSYFCKAGEPQQVEQKKYILAETKARLSEAAIRILGV